MKFFLKKSAFVIFLFPLTAFAQHYETKMLRNNGNQKIYQYETIEIGIRIPMQERMFKLFLDDHSKGVNPYTQNFLRLQFVCHGKIYNVPAFYMQDAVPDEKLNKYVTTETEWPWRVRFAVPDTGSWQCNILTGETVEMSVPHFSGIAFECVAGKNHGYLNVASNHNHFQYTDGTPFFALGQNIAWSDSVLREHPQETDPQKSGGYYGVYHYMNNLADNGGNYVRIYMAHWSTGIEWENLGVYDQNRAVALDSILKIAEARGLHIQLSLDISNGFGINIPKDQWSPYRKFYEKEGGTAADVLNDTNALKQFDNYIRYVYARWAFSPAVASIEILSEQNYWDGYAQHEDYFRNFITHVNTLLRNELGDHVHMLSTSCGEKKYADVFSNPALSFCDLHFYGNNFYANKKRFEIIHDRAYAKNNKPFLFGETGMINGPKNNSDADDFEGCNDISFHNTFWATMFMGDAGCGIYWWQWKSDSNRENNFPALRYFVDSIAGSTLYSGESKMWEGNGLETFYKISSSKDTAVGWMHNQSYWWGNMMHDCRDRFGKEKFLPKDNDKADKPESRAGKKIKISGLAHKRYYLVGFYDTRNPKHQMLTTTAMSNRHGVIYLAMPDVPDCAFSVIPAPDFGGIDF